MRFCVAVLLAVPALAVAEHGEAVPVADQQFELATPRGGPIGWFFEGDAQSAQVMISKNASGAGKHLSVSNSGQEPLAVYTAIPTSVSCGSELNISVHAWSETAARLAPILLGLPSGVPSIGQPTNISEDRQRQKFTLPLPADCTVRPLYVGFLVFGSADLDDVEFQVDGNPFQLGELGLVEAPDLAQLRAVASSPETVQRSDGAQSILSRRLLGLGEAGHGAAALFAMKTQIIQNLVVHGNLETVALEMPAAAGDIVNAYAKGETNDRQRAIAALVYPAWQTTEFVALIDWLRTHNQTAENPVKFAGIDVQQPRFALERLREVWIHSEEALSKLNDGFEGQEPTEAILAKLSDLAALNTLTPLERRYIRLLDAGLRMGNKELGGKSRSFHLADEAMRLASETSGQVVIWADNTHVTKATGAMGWHLSRSFGSEYGAIGFTFAQGMYSAYGPDLHYEAEPAYRGTHEYVLEQAGLGSALIAFSDLPSDHPLLEPRAFRYIGSRPQLFGEFVPHQLDTHFDAIGFNRVSGATQYIIEPSF